MNITDKAVRLIQTHSKVWLSEKLGITRATLDSRLVSENWRKLEIEKLIKL